MAIGSGSEGANTALQEEYKPDLSLDDAVVLVLRTLKQVMEEKASPQPAILALAVLRSGAGLSLRPGDGVTYHASLWALAPGPA